MSDDMSNLNLNDNDDVIVEDIKRPNINRWSKVGIV